MKTPTKKITAAFSVLSCLLLLSSYTLNPASAPAETSNSSIDEYYEVYSFIEQRICLPMYDSIKVRPGRGSGKEFSRCPSGYEPVFAIKSDSVKTGSFVNGRIVYYRGCNPSYICHFKVCVSKNFVMIKSGGGDYLSVGAWIKRKNALDSQIKKPQVKG